MCLSVVVSVHTVYVHDDICISLGVCLFHFWFICVYVCLFVVFVVVSVSLLGNSSYLCM